MHGRADVIIKGVARQAAQHIDGFGFNVGRLRLIAKQRPHVRVGQATASVVLVGLSVNLAPVADLHHKDAQSAVLKVANHPAIAYPVTPETTQRPGKCLACGAWVFQRGDALIHEIDNAPRCLPIQLAQLRLTVSA